MASIGTTLFPHTGTASASASSGSAGTQSSSSSSTGSSSGSDSLANQNTFLQLLVAQLQYQDPTQPMDGTTFVTQLATFSDLQANMGSKTDLDAISKQYLGTVPSTSTGTTATSGTGTGSSVTGG
jgi:flagellar basal-body rod modification protein FlgD